MNTKYAEGYAIVSEDEQALAFLEDWIRFAQELEAKYGPAAPRPRLGERSGASASSTRTRTAAATRSSTGST